MITKGQIQELVEGKIDGTDLFIVEITVAPGNKIRVEVDGDHGIGINECVEISRHIEQNLDREQEDYQLDVSSPGLDKPLRMQRQYAKNTGRELRVKLVDGTTLEGQLKEVTDTGIKLALPPSKKKKLPAREENLVWENIEESKIIISFK